MNAAMKFHPNMFANDTSMFSSNATALRRLDDIKWEVELIMDWLSQNKVGLNVANC